LDVATVNLSSKMKGYIRRLRHELAMWQHRRNQKRCDRLFDDWVKRLSRNSPDVLIGANFAEYGGVRGHLQAVKKHSRLRVEMAPPDWLLSAIGFYESQCRMQNDFSRLDVSRLMAVHSHVFPLFTDWCLSQKLQRGVFWVHTYHLNYYPEHCRGVMEEWKQQINQSLLTTAKHADVRISVSEWQRKELSDSHDIETIYIPNGVDVDLCLEASADRFRRRQKLDQFVLYVGRNDPVKNPEEFVELARHIPGVCCVMIGGDLSYDSMAELCGALPENIRILGSQPSAVVNDALAAASAVVVPSKREGLPTLVLEAMVHETPLIVADEPGCLEAVRAGVSSWGCFEFGKVGDKDAGTAAAKRRGSDIGA
jgi:glycosyltransferase involved in cell wall biosynthesis